MYACMPFAWPLSVPRPPPPPPRSPLAAHSRMGIDRRAWAPPRSAAARARLELLAHLQVRLAHPRAHRGPVERLAGVREEARERRRRAQRYRRARRVRERRRDQRRAVLLVRIVRAPVLLAVHAGAVHVRAVIIAENAAGRVAGYDVAAVAGTAKGTGAQGLLRAVRTVLGVTDAADAVETIEIVDAVKTVETVDAAKTAEAKVGAAVRAANAIAVRAVVQNARVDAAAVVRAAARERLRAEILRRQRRRARVQSLRMRMRLRLRLPARVRDVRLVPLALLVGQRERAVEIEVERERGRLAERAPVRPLVHRRKVRKVRKVRVRLALLGPAASPAGVEVVLGHGRERVEKAAVRVAPARIGEGLASGQRWGRVDRARQAARWALHRQRRGRGGRPHRELVLRARGLHLLPLRVRLEDHPLHRREPVLRAGRGRLRANADTDARAHIHTHTHARAERELALGIIQRRVVLEHVRRRPQRLSEILCFADTEIVVRAPIHVHRRQRVLQADRHLRPREGLLLMLEHACGREGRHRHADVRRVRAAKQRRVRGHAHAVREPSIRQ